MAGGGWIVCLLLDKLCTDGRTDGRRSCTAAGHRPVRLQLNGSALPYFSWRRDAAPSGLWRHLASERSPVVFILISSPASARADHDVSGRALIAL